MTVILFAAALLCGVPVGLMAGIALGYYIARADRAEDEFDGGYKASNQPPVRTTIWYGRGDE